IGVVACTVVRVITEILTEQIVLDSFIGGFVLSQFRGVFCIILSPVVEAPSLKSSLESCWSHHWGLGCWCCFVDADLNTML
ncbi:18845_t:CDS:2, partial [Racocetra persica]